MNYRFPCNQPDASDFDYAFNTSIASMDESDDNSHEIETMVNMPLKKLPEGNWGGLLKRRDSLRILIL